MDTKKWLSTWSDSWVIIFVKRYRLVALLSYYRLQVTLKMDNSGRRDSILIVAFSGEFLG